MKCRVEEPKPRDASFKPGIVGCALVTVYELLSYTVALVNDQREMRRLSTGCVLLHLEKAQG